MGRIFKAGGRDMGGQQLENVHDLMRTLYMCRTWSFYQTQRTQSQHRVWKLVGTQKIFLVPFSFLKTLILKNTSDTSQSLSSFLIQGGSRAAALGVEWSRHSRELG